MKTDVITIRIEPDLKKDFMIIAQANKMNLTDYLISTIIQSQFSEKTKNKIKMDYIKQQINNQENNVESFYNPDLYIELEKCIFLDEILNKFTKKILKQVNRGFNNKIKEARGEK